MKIVVLTIIAVMMVWGMLRRAEVDEPDALEDAGETSERCVL